MRGTVLTTCCDPSVHADFFDPRMLNVETTFSSDEVLMTMQV